MDTLSAHFYTYDCLAASLLDSLMNGDTERAFAISSELACRKESNNILFKVLCLAWWLQSPNHPLQQARHTAFLENSTHGLFSALVASPFILPPHIAPIVKPTMSIKKAIAKHNCDELYAHALLMDTAALRTLGIAEDYLEARCSTIYKPLEMRILYHACAALTAYPSKCARSPPWTTYPSGGKSGRVFSITDAPCALWGVRPPPHTSLRGDPQKLIQRQHQLFETEEHEIEFYKTQFPDDIPDEWSDAEISKSHGITTFEYLKNPWRAAFFECF